MWYRTRTWVKERGERTVSNGPLHAAGGYMHRSAQERDCPGLQRPTHGLVAQGPAHCQDWTAACLVDSFLATNRFAMSNHQSTAELPRPFYSEWPRSKAKAAKALWAWHAALSRPQPVGGDGTVSWVEEYFLDERERVENTEPLRTVREGIWRAAYEAAETHDLDLSLLAEQVTSARHLQGSVRFTSTTELESFARSWAVPHARLLARLAGVEHDWQIKHVDELARGFFFLARFLSLPHDLENGQLFIPISDLRHNDVSVSMLRDGELTGGMRRLFWKHSIRIRDAFGQGQPLVKDLNFRYRMALKRWWHGALELLNEIERRDFDIWSEPITLSPYRKLQVYLMTVFGRATPA